MASSHAIISHLCACILFFIFQILINADKTTTRKKITAKVLKHEQIPDPVLNAIIASSVPFLSYPWKKGSQAMDRNEDILDDLRSSMTYQINGDISPQAIINNSPELGKVYLHNFEGHRFAAQIQDNATEEISPISSLLPENHDINMIDLTDEQTITNHLKKLCYYYTEEYWNYELCIRNEIRQFHWEHGPNGDHAIRSPDWSLGTYQRSLYVRERGEVGNLSANILKVVDYYADGQYCDETTVGRQAEVHMQCCDGLTISNRKHNKPIVPQTQPQQVPNASPASLDLLNNKVEIKSWTEPSVCSYRIVLCSESLCPRIDALNSKQTQEKLEKTEVLANESELVDIAKTSEASSLVSVLTRLQGVCFYRQENWWTYEFCFDGLVKQYRLQQVPVQMQQDVMLGASIPVQMLPLQPVVQALFILGTAPVDIYNSEELLSSHVSHTAKKRLPPLPVGMPIGDGLLRARAAAPSTLVLEFVNGTECDIKNTFRATTAEIVCGANNLIYEIIEDKTCHYRFKIMSTAFCDIPSFVIQEANYTTLSILPDAPVEFSVALE